MSLSHSRKRATKTNSRISEGEGFQDTPRLIGEEEKHELIRAHAFASRAKRDPVQRATAYLGFFAVIAMLVWGWWDTVGMNIKTQVATGTSEYREMTENMNAFTEQLQERAAIEVPNVAQPTSEANAGSFSELMKSVLQNEPSQKPTRNDLIAPGVVSSSAATSTSMPDPASSAPVIDPNMPGLKLDQ